jgi:magnesium transporter
MQIFHFVNGSPACALAPDAPLPEDGLIWVDFLRSEAEGWACWAEPLIGVAIEPQHVKDSLNPNHPSFFDGTPDYDMLVFQGLGPSDNPFPIETRTVAFFMFPRVLITIRAEDNVSIERVQQRIRSDGRMKSPGTVIDLAHALLDPMVDRYLRIREPLDQRLTELQDGLLDPNNPMNDWRELLSSRRVVRQVEALSESQLEALDAWRRNSSFDCSPHEEVKIRDLVEHVTRVRNHASGEERDIEAAVQLHFAIAAGRTNRVVQFLTVLSAIFFPLTLITGIYGMNFDHMPELHWRYGYFMVLGLLLVVGIGLFLLFRRRRFL